MKKIKVKGHEFEIINIKDSFNRRATQFSNGILFNLKKIGLTEYDLDVPLQTFAMKKAPASVTFYLEGHHLYYSCNTFNNFAENLYVVYKVIEYEVEALLTNKKTIQEFINDFSEDKDVTEKRKEARKIIGVEPESLDLELINVKYKELAKEHHPDMPNGDAEKFKAINHAHKLLKKELQ